MINLFRKMVILYSLHTFSCQKSTFNIFFLNPCDSYLNISLRWYILQKLRDLLVLVIRLESRYKKIS